MALPTALPAGIQYAPTSILTTAGSVALPTALPAGMQYAPIPILTTAGAVGALPSFGQGALAPMPIGQTNVMMPSATATTRFVGNAGATLGQAAFMTQAAGAMPPISSPGQIFPGAMFTVPQNLTVEHMLPTETNDGNGIAPAHFGKVGMREDFKCTSAWRFVTKGQLHTIEIAHEAGVWNVELDGVEVAEKKQGQARLAAGVFTKDKVEFEFAVSTPVGDLPCAVKGKWNPNPFAKDGKTWIYTCEVNDQIVPQCWSRETGDIDGSVPVVA